MDKHKRFFLTTACGIKYTSYLQNIKTAMKNYSTFRKPKVKFTSGDSGKCGFLSSLSLSLSLITPTPPIYLV